jgi:hypothetical protein
MTKKELDEYIIDLSNEIQSMAGGFLIDSETINDENLDAYNDLIHRYIQIQITDRDPEWDRLDMTVKVNLFGCGENMRERIDRRIKEDYEQHILESLQRKLKRRATCRRIILYPWVTTLEYIGFFRRSAARCHT